MTEWSITPYLELSEAALELAKTKDERLAILEPTVMLLKDVEGRRNVEYAQNQISTVRFRTVKAERLKAESELAQQRGKPSEYNRLMDERRENLLKLIKALESNVDAGIASSRAVREAQIRLANVDFALMQDSSKRVAILNEKVKQLRKAESIVRAGVEGGLVKRTDLLMATVRRLDGEIQLQRERVAGLAGGESAVERETLNRLQDERRDTLREQREQARGQSKDEVAGLREIELIEKGKLEGGLYGDASRYLKVRVARLKAEIALQPEQNEGKSTNDDLRPIPRRICNAQRNQATAHMFVRVPHDAIVFVNDTRTRSLGIQRYYRSNLKPDSQYRFRVELRRGEKTLVAGKIVLLRAGESATLTFSEAQFETDVP